jgi:hypothetical protein
MASNHLMYRTIIFEFYFLINFNNCKNKKNIKRLLTKLLHINYDNDNESVHFNKNKNMRSSNELS